MCVTRGKHTWYVARRYSEFRRLHEHLALALQMKTCLSCSELATFHQNYDFPHRFRIRSGFPFTKKKIEMSRMEALNEYIEFLVKTTQGLLYDDEDVFESPSSINCEAISLVRDFLLVPCNEVETEYTSSSDEEGHQTRSSKENTPSGPHLSSFRLRELDLLYREKSPKQYMIDYNKSKRHSSMESLDLCDDFNQLFNTFESPSKDTLIHRHQDARAHCPVQHTMCRLEGLAKQHSRR